MIGEAEIIVSAEVDDLAVQRADMAALRGLQHALGLVQAFVAQLRQRF